MADIGDLLHLLDPRSGPIPDPFFHALTSSPSSGVGSSVWGGVNRLLGPQPTDQQRAKLRQSNASLLHPFGVSLLDILRGGFPHRVATAIQTHDDAIKNEQDRLHTQYKQAGIGGINAMTLARQATLHPELSNEQMHASLLALMKQLGYVPHQAL